MFTVQAFDQAPNYTMVDARNTIEAAILALPGITLFDSYNDGSSDYRIYKLLGSGSYQNRLFVRISYASYGYISLEMMDGWDAVNHTSNKISTTAGAGYIATFSSGFNGYVAKSGDGSFVFACRQANLYNAGIVRLDVTCPTWDTSVYMPFVITGDFSTYNLIYGTNKNPWGNSNYQAASIKGNRPAGVDPLNNKRLLLTQIPVISEVAFWGYLPSDMGLVGTNSGVTLPGDTFGDGVTTEEWLQITTATWVADCIKVAA